MAEDLVPSGQDYGERQQTVAMMNRAGLPLATSAAQPRTGPAGAIPNFPVGRAANPEFDPLEGRTPEDFPFLQAAANQVPTVALAPGDIYREMAASAKSTFAKAVLERLSTR